MRNKKQWYYPAMGERLLQATGATTLSMIAHLAGAITNIILDPIMIFGYFGLPAMSIAGANTLLKKPGAVRNSVALKSIHGLLQ